MQKRRFGLLFMAALLVFTLVAPVSEMCVSVAHAKKTVADKPPARRGSPPQTQGAAGGAGTEPMPGQIDAKAAVLLEASTGTVLFEQSPDEIIEPASFTKVLSLYLIFEGLQQGVIHLTDEVWISETAWRTGGSKMFVGVGTKVPLEELLKGIAVVSGNDACVAAAEHLHGSVDAFVEAMNMKAKELGMSNSHFMNPHGLPAEGQVTTARDMATLAVAYVRRFPEALRFHSMHDYTYNNITQYNRNHLLLKDPTVDGLKTGFVSAAGYHLTGTAMRDGMRLVAVVMGAKTPAVREREALKLLNYGFRHYAMVQPFPQGQPLATVKVWKGLKDQLSLYPVEAASFLVPQAQKKALRWEVHAPAEVTAPVNAGQGLGEVVFYVADQPQKTVVLAAQEDVGRSGWLKSAWQSVARFDKINWPWVGGVLGGIVLIGLLIFFVMNWRSSTKRPRTLS